MGTFAFLMRKQPINNDSFMCCKWQVCPVFFRQVEWYERTSYSFCDLWTPDSIDPSHQPETGPLVRIQFHFLAYVEKTGRRAPGLDALSWIFNCHQPFEAEVSWRGGLANKLLGDTGGGRPFYQTMQTHSCLPLIEPPLHLPACLGGVVTSQRTSAHLLHPSIHPSVRPTPLPPLLPCAVMLSDAPPTSSLPSWLASSSVACHGGCAPSKLIDSSFFQKDVVGYQRTLRSPATGGAWLAGRLLKTVIPPLMPPSWKFRIVSAKTPYAK